MTVRRIVPPWDPVAASYAGGPPTTMLRTVCLDASEQVRCSVYNAFTADVKYRR